MIKLCCFDLDNCLVFTAKIHFESLNKAINEVAPGLEITEGEHDAIYNGLPTKRKLELLNSQKGLRESDWKLIYQKKQEYTEFFVRKLITPRSEERRVG